MKRVNEIHPKHELPKRRRRDDGVPTRKEGEEVMSARRFEIEERTRKKRKDSPFRLSLSLFELDSDIEPERVRLGKVVDHRPVYG